MREQKNKSQKGIVVLLAFIAVCMVCIIVLLASNIITSSKQGNDTAEKEASEQVEDTQDEQKDTDSADEEFENGYVTVKGEKHPLYVWNAELTDEPITPTEVEETWILEGMNTTKYPEMSKQLEDVILEHAKNYECHGNPTIVNCMAYPQDIQSVEAIMVDYRTKEHDVETFVYAPVEDKLFCDTWQLDYNKVKPYRNEDGKYIINANYIYVLNERENLGYTDEDLETMQKKILAAAKQCLIEQGKYDEFYEDISTYVLSSAGIQDKDHLLFNLYTTLKDGTNFNVGITCSFDDENYY